MCVLVVDWHLLHGCRIFCTFALFLIVLAKRETKLVKTFRENEDERTIFKGVCVGGCGWVRFVVSPERSFM